MISHQEQADAPRVQLDRFSITFRLVSNMMKVASLFLIIFSVIVIIAGIVKLHQLPGKIARERCHPQYKAIEICSLLGLLVFPFWMAALIWAYVRPVFEPVAIAVDSVEVE